MAYYGAHEEYEKVWFLMAIGLLEKKIQHKSNRLQYEPLTTKLCDRVLMLWTLKMSSLLEYLIPTTKSTSSCWVNIQSASVGRRMHSLGLRGWKRGWTEENRGVNDGS